MSFVFVARSSLDSIYVYTKDVFYVCTLCMCVEVCTQARFLPFVARIPYAVAQQLLLNTRGTAL